MNKRFLHKKAWVVAVDMGYGHQRPAYALKNLAWRHSIITANNYPGIPFSDKLIWRETRRLYEIISRFKKVPVLGDLVFYLFDKLQAIREFYPLEQGIEPPTLQLRQIYGLMKKKNFGKHLIEKLNRKPIPLVTTFFTFSHMAEYWGYEGKIFAVVTDSDISRTWAPLRPHHTNIHYCVPTKRAAERLERYGIPADQIFYTGFPLPEELLGKSFKRAKQNLAKRLRHLDPERKKLSLYAQLVRQHVGRLPNKGERHPHLTLTFAIGGAGAQQEVGEQIMGSLSGLLKKRLVRLNLIAGTHKDIAQEFYASARKQGLSALLGKELFIVYHLDIEQYFRAFNRILASTDVLWTKPSELVFYAGLGLPLILAPAIGSQEEANRRWILDVGAGVDQLDPKFAHEWLNDMLREGLLAEAALDGFLEIEKNGAKHIRQLVEKFSAP